MVSHPPPVIDDCTFPDDHIYSQDDRIFIGEAYYTDARLNLLQHSWFDRELIEGGVPDTTLEVGPSPPTRLQIVNSAYVDGPPIGEGQTASRLNAAIKQFKEEESNAVNATWGYLAITFFQYISYLTILTANPILLHHHILSGHNGAQIKTSLKSQVNGAIAMLLNKIAYDGWMAGETITTGVSLARRATESQRNKEIHYMFVLPCIVKVLMTMDKYSYVDIETILTIDIGTWENGVKRKANAHGVWDRLFVESEVRNRNIGVEDNLMCRGIRYEVARIFSLTMVNFRRRWNKKKSEKYLTADQMATMSTDLERHVVNQVNARKQRRGPRGPHGPRGSRMV